MEPGAPQSPVPMSRDVSRYSLSVEEVVLLLVDAGLPRSERSIQRACKRGHFEAILGDTENGQRYFITPESVDRRIRELKQIESQKPAVAADRDAPRHDAKDRDSSGHAASGDQSEESTESQSDEESGKRIKNLELEILNLRIDNRAKEQFINHMAEDRKELMSQVRDGWEEAVRMSAKVGKLETQLQLAAPNEPEVKLFDSESLDHRHDEEGDIDLIDGYPRSQLVNGEFESSTTHSNWERSQPLEHHHPNRVE